MQKRRVGRSRIEVSAIGLGTWPIGGVMIGAEDGVAHSWGEVDDAEAIRAIRWALDHGVTFFDSSNNYGCGHAEMLLGEALAGRRDEAVIASKFGYICKENSREIIGSDASPEAITRSLEGSLRRLRTDYIDLYQFHIPNYDPVEAVAVREFLEDLVHQGKIRCYGWSTNSLARAQVFAEGENCAAIQYHFNLLERQIALLELCEEHGVATIARGPLGMGLLTGKYDRSTIMPEGDFRQDWNMQGAEGSMLDQLAKLREVLTSEGHTLPQAALAWLLKRGENIVPIPGFKTLKQVQDNIAVLEKGPLSDGQMDAIEQIIQGFEANITIP